MHALEHAILGVFKESPEATRSTTELVQALLPHEWAAVMEQLRSMDSHRVRRGKDAKARLHRKLLYHVNKLVKDRLLRIHAVQGRGEKRFALVVGAGDVEIRSGRKQIRIRKPTRINTPVDGLRSAVVFDREHWLERVNAVLVQGVKFNTFAGLSDFLVQVAPHVNDVIGVIRAETLLEGTIADYDAFIDRVKRVSCSVSLLMSVGKLGVDAHLVRFCRVLAEKQPKNVSVVFNVTPQSLQERREVLTRVVEIFSRHNIKVNMKNSATHSPPVVCGRAGAYALTQNDWEAYLRTDAPGFVVCGASVAVDVGAVEQVHKDVRKAAEALFLVGRSRNVQSLRALGVGTAFLVDVVRLWNYDLGKDVLLAEVDAAVAVMRDFCTLQERVYRACGLPIRCRTVLSCAFGTFPGLSPRAYKKQTIKGLPSLQDEGFSEYLLLREGLARRFCADRVRVFRSGAVDAVAIIREFGYVLNTYALPYVTYDFHGLQGTVRLTEFFGGVS